MQLYKALCKDTFLCTKIGGAEALESLGHAGCAINRALKQLYLSRCAFTGVNLGVTNLSRDSSDLSQ